MLISNISDSHKNYLLKLLTECDGSLIIVSPFIADGMLDFLEEFNFDNFDRIELITTFKANDPEQLTKPFQLRDFLSFFKNRYPDAEVVIHVNNSLHGKLYIAGRNHKKMILTSGNFTRNGMTENHEWGIWIEDNDIIQKALEELFDNIDYPELSYNQLKKACMFAEKYAADNPKWSKPPNISCDILESVYSDADDHNSNPQYFLKPIGDSDHPVTLDSQEDFSSLHQNLHFSKRKPKGVRKGDYVITTAVGAGSLLSYFRVTGGLQHVTEEEIKREPWMGRWPWYMEGRNNSPEFGREWWMHNIRRQEMLDEFRKLHPDIPVTQAGGFTLGTINMGNDKVRITKEFGEFLISKVKAHESDTHENTERDSKYDALKSYLRQQNKDEVTLFFEDAQRILGFPLPPSAVDHRTFWGNQKDTSNRPWARAWQAAGYYIDEVHQAKHNGWVRFKRTDA